MTSLTQNGQTTTYRYAGDGRLAQINGTRLMYDDGLVVQERDASNTPTRGYTWGLNLGGGIGGLLVLAQGGQKDHNERRNVSVSGISSMDKSENSDTFSLTHSR